MRDSLNPCQLRGGAFYLLFDLEFPTLEVNDLQSVNRLMKHCLGDLIFQSLVAFL